MHAKHSVISQDHSNAKGRDKLYHAALDAGQHLASLLQVLGALHPACSVVGSSLSAIIALEQERGEVQSIIAAVYLKLCECLSRVRGIPESFTSEGLAKDKLASFLDRAKGVIEQIGSFSQQYHGDKSLKFRCKRVLFSSSDRKKVDGFLSAIQELNEELNFVVAVRTMEMTQQARFESVDISKLQPHSADIERLLPVDGQPWPLEETVIHHIAQIIRRQFTDESGEHDVLQAVTTVLRTQDNLDDENKALFDIKYQFELERINRKLDYWETRLLEELRKGSHSLIPDGDLQEIWKDTAGRKSSVEWRLFIDGLSHYFQREFMANPARKHKQDSWAVGVITRVCYYPAICDAIDKDASGYISASEVAEFLQTRPTERDAAGVPTPICSVPEWLAYCAYGWDADNILCALQARENFDRIRQLKGKENNPPRTYVRKVAKQFDLVTKSLFRIFQDLPPEALLQMERIRERRRAIVNDKIELNLQKLGYRLDQASSVVAITGDERLEWTFYPLLKLLTSTHLDMFEKNETKNARLDSAIGTLLVLFDAFDIRVTELKRIWRRQGLDINRQMRYYANGMYLQYFLHYSPKPQLGDTAAPTDKTVAGIEDLGMGDLAHTDADISRTRSRLALVSNFSPGLWS